MPLNRCSSIQNSQILRRPILGPSWGSSVNTDIANRIFERFTMDWAGLRIRVFGSTYYRQLEIGHRAVSAPVPVSMCGPALIGKIIEIPVQENCFFHTNYGAGPGRILYGFALHCRLLNLQQSYCIYIYVSIWPNIQYKTGFWYIGMVHCRLKWWTLLSWYVCCYSRNDPIGWYIHPSVQPA